MRLITGRSAAPILIAAAALATPFLLPFEGAAHPDLPGVTWDDVGPVIADRCVGCHRADGIASPSLETYEDAQRVAQAIKWSVLDRRMPPWRAAAGFGDFANDPSLTATEVELLAAWAERGARPGQRADAANGGPTEAPPADLVLRAPDEHRIMGARHTFEVALEGDRERWLKGWQFRPGNAAAVTQAEVRIVNQGPLGSWLPPEGIVTLPDAVAYRLRPGATFRVDVRYRKMSADAVDRSELALYFSEKPKWEARHLTLPCGSTRTVKSLRILSILPSLGSFGDAMEIVARRPDGGIAPLGWFRNYPPNFRATYRYRDPVQLPKSSRIDLRSADRTCTVDIEYVAD
jgi:hypothetical protein